MKVRGPDPTGERERVYEHVEQLADERERNEGGRGLQNLVRKMNYIENHHLSAVAEKYPVLIKKVLGRRRLDELIEEQNARMAMNDRQAARELAAAARELSAGNLFPVAKRRPMSEDDVLSVMSLSNKKLDSAFQSFRVALRELGRAMDDVSDAHVNLQQIDLGYGLGDETVPDLGVIGRSKKAVQILKQAHSWMDDAYKKIYSAQNAVGQASGEID